MKIILASASPRRIELIKKLGCDTETVRPQTDEKFDECLSLEDNLISVAAAKGLDVKDRRGLHRDEIIVSADTVVNADGTVMGKPADAADAAKMLRKLAGHTHTVLTAVCLFTEDASLSFCEKTDVEFAPMSDSEIEYYISTGEPFDKAGAYAVQGAGALFISGIYGDYYNVMGLPLNRLYRVLRDEFGFQLMN